MRLILAAIFLLFSFPALAYPPHPWVQGKGEECVSLYNKIQDEIVSANYCKEHTDCMVTAVSCPFGACTPVPMRKKADRKMLAERVDQFRISCGACKVKCPKELLKQRYIPLCREGKCVLDPIKKPEGNPE